MKGVRFLLQQMREAEGFASGDVHAEAEYERRRARYFEELYRLASKRADRAEADLDEMIRQEASP